MAGVDETVSVVLDFFLLIFRQTLVMGDVQMGFPIGLLGTSLPDVGSKDLTAGGKNEMGTSVMGLELCAT